MATLRDIKLRINGVKNTSKITQAMKMVAAAKLNRAQNAIQSAKPYVEKMGNIISKLISSLNSSYSNELLHKYEIENHHTIIVVSSDKGLCGAFNTNLFKVVDNYINKMKNENENFQYQLITVGRKSTDFFKKRKYNIRKTFINVFQDLHFELVKDILESSKIDFKSGETQKILVFYNEFVNVIKQDPTYLQLLPIDSESLNNESNVINSDTDYIYEPNQAEILDKLLPNLVDIRLWKTILDSNAAEQAARMFAMDNATNNANDLISHLNLIYNRERQAAITTEMLEIVSGANALKSD